MKAVKYYANTYKINIIIHNLIKILNIAILLSSDSHIRNGQIINDLTEVNGDTH